MSQWVSLSSLTHTHTHVYTHMLSGALPPHSGSTIGFLQQSQASEFIKIKNLTEWYSSRSA